jgi:hypothetical protein
MLRIVQDATALIAVPVTTLPHTAIQTLERPRFLILRFADAPPSNPAPLDRDVA